MVHVKAPDASEVMGIDRLTPSQKTVSVTLGGNPDPASSQGASRERGCGLASMTGCPVPLSVNRTVEWTESETWTLRVAESVPGFAGIHETVKTQLGTV
jgi:hypothetical protein